MKSEIIRENPCNPCNPLFYNLPVIRCFVIHQGNELLKTKSGTEAPCRGSPSRFLSFAQRRLLSVVLVRDGQLLATLGTARSQHAAAVLRGHALAEAMLVHAAAIVGLKCSFHCFILFKLF